jgi:glycerol-3-phosphate O-acyltransferase
MDLRAAFWDEVMALRDLLKFEFFFPDKETYRSELASELAARDPGWEAALASAAEVRGLVQRLQPLLAHVVLRPFLEAYQVVGDELESEQVVKSPDESAFLTACLARAQQYVLQRRILSRESVSRVLFQSALRLARNRGLLDAQATPEALRACRSAFATEIRTAIRRIDAIDALAEGRRTGVMG